MGCGPGQFAEYLKAHGFSGTYCGIDFSGEAIQQARRRCPDYQFLQARLPLDDPAQTPEHDTVICLEVLEHVEKDTDILQSIMPGKFIIASVPNFDSLGHVRYFRDAEQVRARYAPFFEDMRLTECRLGEKNIIWLMHGHRATG